MPNIYILMRAVLVMNTRKPPPKIQALEKGLQGPSLFPMTNPYQKDSLQLTPAFREMDYPLHVPDNVVSCGPILRFHQSLSEKDPAMAEWLNKSTILISLGSHVLPTEDTAIEMAKAIHTVLENHPELQVLWKLRYDWKDSVRFQDVLGVSIDSGSVRIVSWIHADLIAVLETGKIAVYVHHGGANSYFEACKYVNPTSIPIPILKMAGCSFVLCFLRVGTPQVVLPQWLDTYDCATRVEWLGIGVHGSRKTAPGIDAEELSQAMETALQDENIRAKSAAMRDICKTTEGRVLAHDRIADFAL